MCLSWFDCFLVWIVLGFVFCEEKGGMRSKMERFPVHETKVTGEVFSVDLL